MRTFHPFLVEPEISERKSPWSKFDKMPLDEKRELYRCGKDFVTLDSILPWSEYLRENVHAIFRKKRGAVQRSLSLTLRQLYSFFHVNASLVSHCHCILSLSTSDRLCSLRVSYDHEMRKSDVLRWLTVISFHALFVPRTKSSSLSPKILVWSEIISWTWNEMTME